MPSDSAAMRSPRLGSAAKSCRRSNSRTFLWCAARSFHAWRLTVERLPVVPAPDAISVFLSFACSFTRLCMKHRWRFTNLHVLSRPHQSLNSDLHGTFRQNRVSPEQPLPVLDGAVTTPQQRFEGIRIQKIKRLHH